MTVSGDTGATPFSHYLDLKFPVFVPANNGLQWMVQPPENGKDAVP